MRTDVRVERGPGEIVSWRRQRPLAAGFSLRLAARVSRDPTLRPPRAGRARREWLPARARRSHRGAARAWGCGVSAVTLPVTRPVDDIAAPVALSPSLDEESRAWLRDLRSDGSTRDDAIARLHALLVRAARFEIARRRPTLPHLRGDELDD